MWKRNHFKINLPEKPLFEVVDDDINPLRSQPTRPLPKEPRQTVSNEKVQQYQKDIAGLKNQVSSLQKQNQLLSAKISELEQFRREATVSETPDEIDEPILYQQIEEKILLESGKVGDAYNGI